MKGKLYTIHLSHAMQDIAPVAKDNNSVHSRDTLIAGQLISSQYYRTCEVKELYGFYGKHNIFGTIRAAWCLFLFEKNT